ncbi:hypothetical protein SAMN04515691_0013 [Leifsonia sp. 98AMF]|uniref:hypothetical protein n=1 Tax=unclassified Leifsonia TaxID=2663824 RepID=UPI00087B050C|nr:MULTISPECIES: hypothetical protein [unclassified Leifsonia]SDH75288.1 hypothetical protein SAMN04515690_4008 [Leifsonia sp. 197AMF]SDJ46412.1 hypothetical protein SAMN04515684_3795 [Leifsonia sp. 466MF]SDK28993.1 hypothetical protein SAMN04515683_2970 [Leifsonia sp. 157MF]SDN66625.1 hypothetical protein SAMN04515686_1982 [Leifsonia sp. 509MF]SEN41861.1 hypothetical protein SAMN04515685_2953 [Leifsonia sp. 467MF]
MDLRDVAGELYSVAPGDFIARRNAAAAQADRSTAKQIKTLRKPSASAAAINALTREHPDLVGDVLEIGSRMRDAFASRDRAEIRALTQERQRLLQRATDGLDLSPAVQREVEETLQAAVIDPAAAAAVRSGMLVRALESTGLEQVDVSDAVALPIDIEDFPAPRPGRRKAQGGGGGNEDAGAAEADDEPAAEEHTESPSERRERQRRIRAAEKAVARAREDAEALDDELDETVDHRGDLEAERDSLQRRLQRITDDLSETRAAERELRSRISDAQRAVREAEKALRDARDD